jgi:PAS domain S-box-containing protein
MGQRIRDFDWPGHPLGPPEGWPQSLKVAIRIMLTSRYAMWLGWGPEIYFFCNDAYAHMLGVKRESVLGLSARKVCAEIWSDLGPHAESIFRSGETTWDESLLLFLERSGYPEETYHTFSCSPLPDDDGAVGGMLCVVTEETERVIDARRLALLRDLGSDLAVIKEKDTLFHAITARLAERTHDLPFALIYLLATDGESVRLACAHGVAAGSPMAPQMIGLEEQKPVWPAATVFAGSESVTIGALSARFPDLPTAQRGRPPRSALLVPIAGQSQERPAGFLVAGLNPYRPLDAAYRGFLDLLVGQIAAGLASARACEAERKRAHFEPTDLAASEILESMNLAFMAMDEDFRIIYLNAEAGRLHGMTPEKYLGRIHWEAFPASVGTLIETKYRRAMTERVPLHFENFYQPWQKWFELNAYPMTGGRLGVFFREISEYKRTVEALRASEEQFRQIANTMPQMVWVTHPDGRHEYFNRRWYEFTGVPEGSTGGEGWAGLFHPADDARVRAHWRQNLESGEPYEIEYRLRRHDGRYCWFLCRALPVRDSDGRVVRWFGTCTDIDDFKRVEESLRRTHDQLQTVMSSITDGLAVLDKQWRYTYVSDQAARIIGMRPEQLLGGCVWELFPKAKGTKFHEGYHRALETGQSVEFEEFYPEPMNKWLECRCYPSAEGLSVYFHDITARKQAEALLRQNEALFSTLIEQAPLGVYVVDAQFRLQQINSIALPAFDQVRPLIGRDFSEVMEILWGPEVGGECTRIFRHTLETGERYISPLFSAARHDLGVEQAFDWETQRVTLPDGQHGVVCYFTDVTERRRAEAALQEAKDAAVAANSSKDRFLAVLSHELRTPLTPVLMTVGMLENDPDLRPDLRADLAMIKRNVELETKLIDDLLDLNRIISGKLPLHLEPLDLNAALRDVCGICRPTLQERGIALELTLDDSAGSVFADFARLRQVIWNVLNNAIKFSSEAGTIRVTTRRLAGGLCEVRVRDNGIGIPPEVLPCIFNAFEQGRAEVTRRFGGLGLGLAICKALLELHHGTIRAESPGSGQGSTFIIELPGAVPASLAKSPAVSAADKGMRQLRLLLVEDHPDTALALSSLLGRAGYAVLTAADVAGAVATAEREPFDLLICDLGLPDGNGHDVIGRVRAHRIVPAIAMSGYGMDEDVRRSREAGFTEHLVKPIDVQQLIAAIRRVAASEI